jgi:hypothetical protein
MSYENDMVATRALLDLRALREVIETHIGLVITCTNQEEMTTILFGLSDTLKTHGRDLEKLATRAHGSVFPPPASIPPTTAHLPSSIPPGEEPEEEAYRSFISGESDSGVRKTAEHPGRKGIKL